MISADRPEGRNPYAPRQRRRRRNSAAGMITGPPSRIRAEPSVAPVVTSEPALEHCAAFWRQGLGAGAGERCPLRVLWAATFGAGAAAPANGAQATRRRRAAPTAVATQRQSLTERGYKSAIVL